jgi:predicted CXXCH cytochrome family protein
MARGRRSLIVAGALAVILVAGVGGASAQSAASATDDGGAAGKCGVCHPRERVLFERSRHAQEKVGCVGCHGGDERSLTVAGAHGAGFRGKPARKDIPALCASCHASETRMRPYNLPVDQFALYQTSGHGVRLARGDTRVAVCSDCHRAHDILPPSDPASSVYVLNIPRACGQCHGDTTLMRSRGRADAYREYMSSVHAKELFDKGNLRAPTCVSCHGIHGAAPPQLGDVDKICGQCHTAERRYFMAGPHSSRLAGSTECTSCHLHHATTAAKPERLASGCTDCHDAKSKQAALGKALWTEYQSAAAEIDKAVALVAKADAVPIATEDYRARIEDARTYLREAMPAAHAVQEDVVASFTARARSVGSEVESEIYGKLGRFEQRKFVLVLFWFYLVLTVVVQRRFRDRGAPPR